ncbi:MAG TPA: ABC transporter ATP-binding protein [Methanomassiliicoccales archaeon]|nr:ABC transporter ATP-binding protein [Methanomassiliicoccales archaeon]
MVNIFTHPVKTIKEARKTKERFWALKDVNLSINKGEAIGIIGSNGAGKSTLLKVLSQVTRPTEGEVLIRGKVGSLLEVGTGFHPELTGMENIYLNGSILGMKKAEIDSKFDDIVKFSEVEKFLDTPVKRYSSGMYVRLAFAIAAHLEPEILIVDEVLAVGDAQFQKKCLGKMKDVSEGGRTVLYVSHNMKTVEALCGRTVLLDQGRVAMVGPTSEVTQHYLGMGGGQGEIFRVSSPILKWIGLINRSELNDNSPDQDLEFVIEMQAGSDELHHLVLDLYLYNEKDVMVLEAREKYLDDGFDMKPGERIRFTVVFKSPKLAPGRYHMAVKVGTLFTYLWVERVDACNIIGKAYFGNALFFENVRSAVLPEYTMSVERKK